MRRTVVAAAALAAVTLAIAAAPALACLWDHDTLAEESLGQKDTLEVVTGKLRHHATAWYEAKVVYTRAIVDGGRAPKERYDDLAVALAKTGQVDDGLAVLAAKAQRFPGEYTTEANLGTLAAMKGDPAGALDHLRAAIAINPDAHFGREKYQVQLLAYLTRVQADPSLVEREDFLGLPITDRIAFALTPKRAEMIEHDRPAVPKDAVAAIVGLIRFGGNDDNMHLWFSLGLALGWQGHKNLALRALRRADVLGHPLAAEVGGWIAIADRPVMELRDRRRDRGGELGEQAWAVAAEAADADWARGTAWEAAREAAEVKLAGKRPRQAFGY
jgi:tetratricopeptide (TPR) repeat protein